MKGLQEGFQAPFEVYYVKIVLGIKFVERHEVGGIKQRNVVRISRCKCRGIEALNVFG